MDIGFSSYHNGGPAREQDFSRLSQTIGTSILKISQNVSSMQKMVNQLGSSTDSQELRNKLHQIQHYTQQLAKDTSGHLRDLANNSGSSSPGEQRQRKMQRERLQDEFTTALNSFQAVQRLAATKEKEMVRKAKASAGIAPFGEKKQETLIELQDSRTQKQIQQQQLKEEQNLRMLEEQEASIRQLESNISDINQIFKDLGALVYDQGEVVDSIEASVERTEVSVNEATSHAQYDDKRCKCICPSLSSVINTTQPSLDRLIFIINVPPSQCKCEDVVLPKLGDQIKTKEEIFCPRCDCKYENRNTTIIKIVVIIVIWVISLLVIYMLFLICLDPLLNKRIHKNTTNIGYHEHNNEEDDASVAPGSSHPMGERGNVLNRVGHQQDKWKRQVREQRRNIYDRHTMLN
ncbi:PREDICTED: syntaxin-7-like [Polistes dominula]|uniref:Syntaxin-7-like n=1 Tax=Polistes dominula TaxID=743375 RepID=A0ABM1ILN1_POLDO|nr:PREDICTED: syntaxin-7-like [Polistes dominula]XP_015181119.1 PREDICTED: syntaxin-7-like [Polistes dominula]